MVSEMSKMMPFAFPSCQKTLGFLQFCWYKYPLMLLWLFMMYRQPLCPPGHCLGVMLDILLEIEI